MLDYLRNEQDPKLKLSLQTYVAKHGDEMLAEMKRQAIKNAGKAQFTTPYRTYSRGTGATCIPNYYALEKDIFQCVVECREAVAKANSDGNADAVSESVPATANATADGTGTG